MRYQQLMRLVLKAMVAIFALTPSLWACPFCSPTDSDLYTILASSKAVAKAVRVGPNKFKLVQVLSGKAQVGRIVLAKEPQESVGAETVLLLSTVSNPAQPYWSEPVRALDPREFSFFKTLLAAKSQAARQDLAATHFLDRSELVSDAAYNILALAPLEAVQSRADKAGVKNLVAAALDERVEEDRKSLVYLMLFPHVTKQDSSWLRDRILKPRPNPQAVFLPALMAAYAEAAGPSSVSEMAQIFLTKTTTISNSFQPVSGFKFIATQATMPETRDAAKRVVRGELSNPQRGVFVIEPLAQWRDYSVAGEVEQSAYRNGDTPWVVGAAIRYFRSFKTPAAEQALKRLDKAFPEKLKDYPRGY